MTGLATLLLNKIPSAGSRPKMQKCSVWRTPGVQIYFPAFSFRLLYAFRIERAHIRCDIVNGTRHDPRVVGILAC